MGSIDVRYATLADLPAIGALHTEATSELARMLPPGFGETFLESAHDAAEARLLFSGKISQEEGFLLVAEVAGAAETANDSMVSRRIAGFLVAHVEEYGDDLLSAPFLTIEDVVVGRPRILGVGATLIHAAEVIARERGIMQIDLLVWADNAPARALYQKLGYSVLEERRGKRLK